MSYPKEKRVVSPVVAAIREERRRQGIGLERLAKMAGYTHQHLWQIEVGKQGVRIDILETLAAALGGKIRFDMGDRDE